MEQEGIGVTKTQYYLGGKSFGLMIAMIVVFSIMGAKNTSSKYFSNLLDSFTKNEISIDKVLEKLTKDYKINLDKNITPEELKDFLGLKTQEYTDGFNKFKNTGLSLLGAIGVLFLIGLLIDVVKKCQGENLENVIESNAAAVIGGAILLPLLPPAAILTCCCCCGVPCR